MPTHDKRRKTKWTQYPGSIVLAAALVALRTYTLAKVVYASGVPARTLRRYSSEDYAVEPATAGGPTNHGVEVRLDLIAKLGPADEKPDYLRMQPPNQRRKRMPARAGPTIERDGAATDLTDGDDDLVDGRLVRTNGAGVRFVFAAPGDRDFPAPPAKSRVPGENPNEFDVISFVSADDRSFFQTFYGV